MVPGVPYRSIRFHTVTRWDVVPDDANRAWRFVGNQLTDEAQRHKGGMLQAAARPSYDAAHDVWPMVELKTEVVWGRAYMAGIPLGPYETIDGYFDVALVVRDDDAPGGAVIEVFNGTLNKVRGTYRV